MFRGEGEPLPLLPAFFSFKDFRREGDPPPVPSSVDGNAAFDVKSGAA